MRYVPPMVGKWVWIGGSLCILAAPAAHAQSGAEGGAVEVTVQGHWGPPRVGVPETVRRHHRVEDIEGQTPLSLADALRRAPAVSVQQTTPAQTTIYVRGLSGREVAHLVNGVRVNSAIYRAGNVPYLALIDAQALASIDVVPGAGSVLYGSDALAGAILMTTRLPGYTLDDPTSEISLKQILSSNPLASSSRVEALRSERNWSLRMGVTATAAGPIRPGEGQQTPVPSSYYGIERDAQDPYRPLLESRQSGTEYQFFGADIAFRRKLGSRFDLVTEVQYSVIPDLVRYDQVTPRFKRETPSRAESRLFPLSRTMASVLLSHRPSQTWYQEAELLLSWQRLAEDSFNRGFDEVCLADPSAEACTGTVRLSPSPTRVTERNRSVAFGVTGEMEIPLQRDAHVLRLGLSSVLDLVSSETTEEDLSNGSRSAAAPRFPDGSSLWESGLFALLESEIDGSFNAYAGARGSLFQLDIARRDRLGDEAESPGQSLSVLDWSAGAGVVVSPVPGLDIDANVGRGLRVPNVQDLATLGPRAGGRYQVPNPDLKPEHSYSADAGARFSVGNHRIETSLFYLLYGDAIVLAPTTVAGASTTNEGDTYYHSVNAASIRMLGFESSAEVRVVDALAPYARALGILGEQQNPPESGLPERTPADRVPPFQGELGVRLFATMQLELRAFTALRMTQRRLNDPTNLDDDRIPEGGTPGFATFHLHASYAPARNIVARLNLDNLTDRLVLEHGSGFYRAGFSASASVQARVF